LGESGGRGVAAAGTLAKLEMVVWYVTWLVTAALFAPTLPQPLSPRWARGELTAEFGCFAPTTVLLARGCDAGLIAPIGWRGGRSKWLTGGSADTRRARRCCADRRSAVAAAAVDAYDVRASERARSCSRPFGRAEQRSGARIRAGACLSEASLRLTPSGASSARQPAGPRPAARLSFAYFSLAKQRKVSRPPGRNPVSPNAKAKPPFSYRNALTKEPFLPTARPPGRNPAKSPFLRTSLH